MLYIQTNPVIRHPDILKFRHDDARRFPTKPQRRSVGFCREIADYGLTKAHEQKGYQPQTLLGIGQFINEFFATKAERDRLVIEQAAREEVRRREATIERQKEGYEVFYKTEIMRVRQGLSPEELETLEAPLRAQFRQKYPGMKAGIDMYVYFEGNAVLQERYKIPTFEEWQAKNQASEGVVFDRSRRGV